MRVSPSFRKQNIFLLKNLRTKIKYEYRSVHIVCFLRHAAQALENNLFPLFDIKVYSLGSWSLHILFIIICHRYMAEILPIRRKILFNQSILFITCIYREFSSNCLFFETQHKRNNVKHVSFKIQIFSQNFSTLNWFGALFKFNENGKIFKW